ncbi:MAG: TonB-dependent receptor [Chitinophagaceae bacterium]
MARISFVLPFVLVSTQLVAQTDSSRTKSMEEVVVTGQYAPQSLKNSVYRVRVIRSEQIRMRAATDVAGILNNELGVRFSTDQTLGESDISIMGMSGQNVKILLDGIPLVDRGSTRQSLSQIDINSVERIELVEGPMSVVYGTDALAGVINIITKKGNSAKSQLSVAARVQEESTGSYYDPFSGDGNHNENISVNWNKNKWRIGVYGTRNTFGGYTDTAAYPAKVAKPKDQWLTGGTIGFRTNKINAWYRLDYLHENIFAAGVMNTNNYKGLDQYYITNRFTHQLQAEWNVRNNLQVNGAVSYQDYKRNTETYNIDYRNGTKTPSDPTLAGNEGQWDVSTFKTFFFRGTAQWTISPTVSLQPGVEVKTDKTTGQRIEGKPEIDDYSFFVSSEIKPLGWLNIRPGVRFSKNSIYDAPPVIPSVNAKISLRNDLDLRVSYARGFRAPSLRELYFYFFDASHSIKGNPNLEAEYSNSFNASLSWQAYNQKNVSLTTNLSGFYNDFSNRIDLALDANNIYTYVNISKYKTVGGTLDNSFNWKNLTATLGFSYVGRYNTLYNDAAYSKEGQHEFTWSPEINSNIIYRFPKLKGQLGFFYKFTGKLPSYGVATDPVTNNEYVYLSKTASYNWADLTASKTILKYVTIQAGVKNLFDVVRIQNNSQSAGGAHSTGGPILTAFGRSYFVGLNFQWSK